MKCDSLLVIYLVSFIEDGWHIDKIDHDLCQEN